MAGSCAVDGRLMVTATVHLPSADAVADGATAIPALPGGGYSVAISTCTSLDATSTPAEHHVTRGLVFVAIDHLGVGASTPEVCGDLRAEDIAAANHAAVVGIADLLERGAVAPAYPPLRMLRRDGVGQSMGGAISIIMVDRHRTYDAVAVVGFSAIHAVLPSPDHVESEEVAGRLSGHRRDADPGTQPVAAATARIPDVPEDVVRPTRRGLPAPHRSPCVR